MNIDALFLLIISENSYTKTTKNKTTKAWIASDNTFCRILKIRYLAILKEIRTHYRIVIIVDPTVTYPLNTKIFRVCELKLSKYLKGVAKTDLRDKFC
jgi:hypothetical protein